MTRLVPVLVLLALVLVVFGLMRLGWRHRGRRQADVPAPAAVPAEPGEPVLAVAATYVDTTTAGDWLDRVVVHGLGVESAAEVGVHTAGPARGVVVARRGAPSFLVPADDLLGVRLDRGMAGKFVEHDGLVVLTWRLGDHRLDTGLRTRHAADRARLVEAVGDLVGPGTTPAVPPGPDPRNSTDPSTEPDQENA